LVIHFIKAFSIFTLNNAILEHTPHGRRYTMNIILFDDEYRDDLLPLVYTRPVGQLKIGLDTISDKWASMLNGEVSYITQDYLSEKYETTITTDNYLINGSVVPDLQLCQLINDLELNEALLQGEDLIAARLGEAQFEKLLSDADIDPLDGLNIADQPITRIRHPWDLITHNFAVIKSDFERITHKREGQTIPAGTHVIGNIKDIFIEEGAEVLASCLNTTDGPIYIGKDALIMEGTLIRGPFSIGQNSIVKMGTKIYGGTSIGNWSKVGGEVGKSLIFDFSNKGHEGYLGNSVIGEWCNLGADTNTSNLKNNYDEVKLWNYTKDGFQKTGQQFIGTIMGDHSKCGINTMFNTGTVAGICCNIYGADYQPNFIASFSWGGKGNLKTYQINKAFETIEAVMNRRGLELSDRDREILLQIFNRTEPYRKLTKAI